MKMIPVIAAYFLFLSLGFASDSANSDARLKEVLLQYLSSSFCNDIDAPQYMANARVVRTAGVKVIPLLVDILSNADLSDDAIGSAAELATSLPYSVAFRNALRNHRDDKRLPENILSVHCILYYFAKHGDESDIVWIQAWKSKLDSKRQFEATDAIAIMKKRLVEKAK